MQDKIPESSVIIRFPDCDPFNHLNNSRYLDYFMNERENHLLETYGFNIYGHAMKTGASWVVSQSKISYLSPARLMEKVQIQSTVLEWNKDNLLVEMKMWNEKKTTLKAVLWSRFVHFDLKKQKRIEHSEFLNKIFSCYENSLDEKVDFEQRVINLRKRNPIKN